ncbi:MAG TPA: endonuclease/exonuclease/phosphatase family protein [Calditrichaeota bacterium]|nr:endonuclease/exonuclease/phosphatase family protein [Calditrichota bacterium]
MKSLKVLFIYYITLFLLFSCEPLATQFEEVSEANLYQSAYLSKQPPSKPFLHVMTWNIRFGAGRLPWFGDSCGDRVILTEREVLQNLKALAELINTVQPDILFVQEIDIQSKRTAYIDQVQWLLDNTDLNYAAYASAWKARYIPSDGLGRMDMGNAVFSRFPITQATRLQLALRGDQDALTQYFYLQRNILKTKIKLPDNEQIYAVNTHLAAFSTDATKHKQIEEVINQLKKIDQSGELFVLGADFNLLPPGSDSTDYCMEDRCPGESFHHPGDDPMHKEGSNYTPEITWLQGMYDYFTPAVDLTRYLNNQSRYFTHTTRFDSPPDRKLDYLFTNGRWEIDSDSTLQAAIQLADHVPVSALLEKGL